MKILPDFRSPDNLRLSAAPLYTSFTQLYDAVARIEHVVRERLYEKYPAKAPPVT
jgi:kynureninase